MRTGLDLGFEDAMATALKRMSETLGGHRKKVDADLVSNYLWVLEGLLVELDEEDRPRSYKGPISPADITMACEWFCRRGSGAFPAGPQFREECCRQRDLRLDRIKNQEWQAARDLARDPLADDFEEPMDPKAARALIRDVLDRLTRKHTNWPGDKSPRDMRREIERMKEAGSEQA